MADLYVFFLTAGKHIVNCDKAILVEESYQKTIINIRSESVSGFFFLMMLLLSSTFFCSSLHVAVVETFAVEQSLPVTAKGGEKMGVLFWFPLVLYIYLILLLSLSLFLSLLRYSLSLSNRPTEILSRHRHTSAFFFHPYIFK